MVESSSSVTLEMPSSVQDEDEVASPIHSVPVSVSVTVQKEAEKTEKDSETD